MSQFQEVLFLLHVLTCNKNKANMLCLKEFNAYNFRLMLHSIRIIHANLAKKFNTCVETKKIVVRGLYD